MTTYSFFANYGQLQVASTDGTNVVSIAAIKGVEMTPEFEHVELYGMEEVTRADVAKHSLKVKVNLKYAKWDPTADTIMQGVLLGDFNRGVTNVAINKTNINTVDYKNKVATFKVTATMYTTDRTKYVTATAHNVYFTSIPYQFNENEFIVRDLTGTAEYMEIDDYENT